MALQIKNISDCDVETVGEIQNTAHNGSPPEPHHSYQLKSLSLHSLSFIAFSDGIPCGYILSEIKPAHELSSLKILGAVIDSEKTCFVYDIGVLPPFRCHNVAKSLFKRLCRSAKSKGAQTVHLVTFSSTQNFWKNLGLSGGPVMTKKL